MTTYHTQASATIEAPADRLYAIIADYHQAHPAILPRRYFTGMTVDEGGRGEGTRATVEMKAFGNHFVYHVTVTEPEPGRVLVEEDQAAGVVTTFAIEPLNGKEASRVTITTEGKTSPGLRGWVEKWLTPLLLRRIYKDVLANLAQQVG